MDTALSSSTHALNALNTAHTISFPPSQSTASPAKEGRPRRSSLGGRRESLGKAKDMSPRAIARRISVSKEPIVLLG